MKALLFFLFALTAHAKTLVVVLAETRAHELTYESFQKNLLDPVDGDLAVCIGVKEDYDYANPYYQNAKYRFLYPEPDDYGSAFDAAYELILKESPESPYQLHWRKFLKIKDQFMGGISDPTDQHPGSAGILIFYRWFLLQNLLKHRLLEKYDTFIITRSDYIYRLPHPKIEWLSPNTIYIPDGESYQGVTDRHAILPREFVIHYLNILEHMVLRGKSYYKKMQEKPDWNLEKLIQFHLKQNGVWPHVSFFPYVMFTVRPINGTTRWAAGKFSPEHNCYIKYMSEFETSQKLLTDFENEQKTLEEFYQQRLRKPQ